MLVIILPFTGLPIRQDGGGSVAAVLLGMSSNYTEALKLFQLEVGTERFLGGCKQRAK